MLAAICNSCTLNCWASRAGQRTDRPSAARTHSLEPFPRTFSRQLTEVKIRVCSLWRGFEGYLKAALEQLSHSGRFSSAVSPEKHMLSHH